MAGDVTFVSGFSLLGHHHYGKRFLNSFTALCNGYRLVLYTHDIKEQLHPDVEQREQDDIPTLLKFVKKAHQSLVADGSRDPGNRWKAKEREAGYSFRFDAAKFCRMVYTMHDAASKCETEYMIWLDGDTVVRTLIPKDIVERALPDGYDYAYLGRPGKYTETGFLVFRVAKVMPILEAWVDYYRKGTYKNESEWHSAWLFDRARERFPEIKGNNLTPKGRGHAIHQCWVGKYFDHLKGNRKFKGRSPEAR